MLGGDQENHRGRGSRGSSTGSAPESLRGLSPGTVPQTSQKTSPQQSLDFFRS